MSSGVDTYYGNLCHSTTITNVHMEFENVHFDYFGGYSKKCLITYFFWFRFHFSTLLLQKP